MIYSWLPSDHSLLVLSLYVEAKGAATVNKVTFAMPPISVSGKRKKGAKKLKPGAAVATIALTTSDGSALEVAVTSPCQGFVLEVNDLLADQPQLVLDDVSRPCRQWIYCSFRLELS